MENAGPFPISGVPEYAPGPGESLLSFGGDRPLIEKAGDDCGLSAE
jgi:hypothetical protein